MTVKRALISVSNKDKLVPFVQALVELGVEIVSTGGTKQLLEENGLTVTSVSDVTDFPEILDGRVKTLHPAIHGGLLARRDLPDHLQQLKHHHITPIDLVVVNLYPFQETIAAPQTTYDEAIENIDIGGPSMLRAAAKNHQHISVIVDPNDYELVLSQLQEQQEISAELRQRLAAKVFRHTAAYDAVIAQYVTEQAGEQYPEKLTLTYTKKQALRYGENPHQHAAFYGKPLGTSVSIAGARQLHGKALSYNNINDAAAALAMIQEFDRPAAVAVKHTNPCGVGLAATVDEAFQKAYEADPISIFGGIVAFNREVDAACASRLKELFLEVILAPSFTDEALALLTEKKNIRLLTVAPDGGDRFEQQVTSIHGGLLIQGEDRYDFEDAEISVPTKRAPTEEEWKNLQLAWRVVKHVKSNAITLAKNEMTVGIGAGQMNRVGAADIALKQAGEQAEGAALASDAFFPMDDTVAAAAAAGVTAIIQPGGSIRDEDSIKKADEHNIAMVFTGIRHFKH